MGFIKPEHIQVKLLKPILHSVSLCGRSISQAKQKVVGNATMNLQKFDDGWKIVASHTKHYWRSHDRTGLITFVEVRGS